MSGKQKKRMIKLIESIDLIYQWRELQGVFISKSHTNLILVPILGQVMLDSRWSWTHTNLSLHIYLEHEHAHN